ncbi:MAG: hypothetical protein ACNYPI_08985 [Arenicellales bacterium WSBS_2016_MAG_OTU3]
MEEIIAGWIKSNNQEKQNALKDILRGDVESGIERLEKLDAEQIQHLQTQKEQAVETKLELAVIYNYRNPETSLEYLKQALKIDPEHLSINNFYGLY